MSWISQATDGVFLSVRVVPRASRTEIAGTSGDILRIRLQAPPLEGKANKALIRFLAGKLHVPARRVEIVSGEASRTKRLKVHGASVPAVRSRLSSLESDH